MKRFLSIVLSLALAIPIISVPTVSHGWTFTDTKGHWAESVIYRAVSYGIVKGDSEGTFRPDAPVTRAEFATMVNNTFGNKGTTNITFTDVPYYEWYYSQVARGVAASYINGYNDNTFRPNAYIQRQEAAAVLDRILPYAYYSSISSAIKDKASIAPYAVESVSKLYNLGYMTGDKNSRFNPAKSLTRAEAAKILCSIRENENIVTANTTVKSRGTTLKNKIYAGDVTISSDVGSGDVDIEDCVIMGTLYVYGGGTKTVTVSNSRVSNAYVSKSSSSVRLLLTDRTVVSRTTAARTAILETEDLVGGLHGVGFNQVDIKGSSYITLRGTFGTVNINGSSADLEIEDGNIDVLNVSSSGKYSEIDLDDDSDIGTVNAFARCDFTGQGIIQTMNVSANNVNYEREPRYVKVTSGYNHNGSNAYYDVSIEVIPGHQEDGIDTDTDITIYFDRVVKKYNGSALKASDIESLIYLRKGSATGTRIPYLANISKSEKVITISPDYELEEDTRYYVVIPANNFLFSDGSTNEAQTTYFYTGDADSSGSSSTDENVKEITFYPEDDAESCSVNVKPTITFPYPIETYAGDAVTKAYLEKHLVLREGGSGGVKVGFTASISSSNRTITITPTDTLDHNTKYYVSLPVKKFRSKDDNSMVPAISASWKTEGVAAPSVSITPNSGASGVSIDTQVNIKFTAVVYPASGGTMNEAYIRNNILFTNNTAKKSVDFYVLSYGGGNFVLKPSLPLDAGSNFTVVVPSNKFKNNSGSFAPYASTTFTTVFDFPNIKTLQDKLVTAKGLMDGVYVSKTGTGSDIFTDNVWVSKLAWDNLQAAIDNGDYMMTKARSSAEVDSAINLLTNHTNDFKKSNGTKEKTADVTKLDSYITDCQTLLSKTVYSADGKDVPQNEYWVDSKATLTDFEAAIKTALETRNSTFASSDTKNICTKAYNDLREACLDFTAARVLGTKPNTTELMNVVDAGYTTLSAFSISRDSGKTDIMGDTIPIGAQFVTYDAYETFRKALAAANNATKAETQAEVNKAMEDLIAAAAAFEASVQVKPDPDAPAQPEGGSGGGNEGEGGAEGGGGNTGGTESGSGTSGESGGQGGI